MFARSYIPTAVPQVMKDWEELLKANNLPFTPENIFESPSTKQSMTSATQVFTQHI